MSRIDPNITFSFRKKGTADLNLGREEIAQRLVRILMLPDGPETIMLDGDWGTGKTEFTYKTLNLIKASTDLQAKAIYINAFNEDYTDNPFFSLMSAIYLHAKNDELKKTLATLFAAFGRGIKIIGPMLDFMAASHGQPCSSAITTIANTSADILNKISDDIAGLKKDMDSLVTLLRMESQNNKIWLFIDELDRCRPTYALTVFEIVKHFVEGTGIRVVYVANQAQLLTSIRYAYGPETDAQSYLRKFVQWKIQLPMQINEYTTCAYLKIKELIGTNNLGLMEDEQALVFSFFSRTKRSLRDAEDFYRAMQVSTIALCIGLCNQYVLIAIFLSFFYPGEIHALELNPYCEEEVNHARELVGLSLSNKDNLYARIDTAIREALRVPEKDRFPGSSLCSVLEYAHKFQTLEI